ncbi:MAG: TIGR01212 family radical SAM protein [Ruminococcaceae bacterium]|nr:TIGR01212 family radical SAM protein [Oscillospiraceae bacterium]
MLYNNLSGYFREKYGQRLKKICIDGGFSCPNRDGKCGTGGCIYCGERGAGEHIDPTHSIKEQVLFALQKARTDDKFIAYFQNFSNTYATPQILKERYDAALIDGRIVALAIGTRPDCLDEEKVRIIAGYKKRLDVWVELGLQTSNDETAKLINRGYPRSVFEKAVELLKKYGIPTVVHMIIGLPGENKSDAVATAKYISSFGVWGIKIHSIYVMRGTRLAETYEKNLYTPPTLDEFCDTCAECVGSISPDTVIHRLTGDCPRDMLIAPDWNKSKNEIIDGIIAAMKKRGISQGSLLI